MAFSTALRHSVVSDGLDKQQIVNGLGQALSRPPRSGQTPLQPFYDLLIRDLRVPGPDAAGIILYVKTNEARYGFTTELPPEVAVLSEHERAAAAARSRPPRARCPP